MDIKDIKRIIELAMLSIAVDTATGVVRQLDPVQLTAVSAPLSTGAKPGSAVAFLGSGHNAGDALVALRVLQEHGWNVAVRSAFADKDARPLLTPQYESVDVPAPIVLWTLIRGEDHRAPCDSEGEARPSEPPGWERAAQWARRA